MKNIQKSVYSVIFFLLLLFPQLSWGQCTTCTTTISGDDNGTYNVTGARTLCITGGTFSGFVSLGGNSNLCITNAVYTGGLNLNNSGDVYISPTATYQANATNFNSAASTIINDGTWNTGNLSIQGDITNNGSFTAGQILLNNNSNLISNGSAFNAGAIQVNGGGNIEVTGDYSVGALNINETATFSGNGTINGGVQVNTGGDLTLDGNVAANSTITNNGALTVSNGTITFAGSGQNNSNGDITINDAVLEIGGAFINNGTITAAGSNTCGQLSIAGSSVQNSNGETGNDGSASQMDICDSSGSGYDVDGGTTGGTVSNCTCEAALPVTLVSFEAIMGKNEVQLQWATALEFNNNYFEIHKSLDGSLFQTIGKIYGKGNSNQLVNYSFTDTEASTYEGIIYYRLKQVDYDGQFTFSRVVSINATSQHQPQELSLYANRQRIVISGVSPAQQSQLQLSVYNLQGRAIATYDLASSNTTSEIDTKLPDGCYIVTIYDESKGTRLHKRIIILNE